MKILSVLFSKKTIIQYFLHLCFFISYFLTPSDIIEPIFIEQYNQSIVNAYKDINEKLIKYNSESRINKESKDILGIKSEVLSRSKKRYEIGKTARRSYVEDNYTYLVSVLTSEQEKFALLNYKIDLINAFGGLYTTNQK